MKILDPDGNDAAARRAGRGLHALARAASTTYRYIGAEAEGAATAGSRSATWAGWTRTATSTSPTARADMILVGGANVYPAEIEAALDEHPGGRLVAA